MDFLQAWSQLPHQDHSLRAVRTSDCQTDTFSLAERVSSTFSPAAERALPSRTPTQIQREYLSLSAFQG
jgi:hypothetical protein